jgi:tetratricopeptide (TPR) repeat protein
MRKNSVTITASILLVFCLVGCVGVLRLVDAVRPSATLQDVLFISSPKVLRRLSLGYEGLLADIYWTRAVQYFGGNRATHPESYDLLYPLLDITTTLDPHLLVAYQFGGNFLSPRPPNGAGQPQQAIRLIEKGIRENPNEPKLYYGLGFIYYDLKDFERASQAFDEGAKLPHAHQFMRILAAQMAVHSGDVETARLLWLGVYESSSVKDIRDNAVAHLRALQVDADVAKLQQAVTRYGQKTGFLPPDMMALVKIGILPGIAVDPNGHPYKLTPEGRIEVQNPDDFPFITKGVPPGYAGPIRKTFDNLPK